MSSHLRPGAAVVVVAVVASFLHQPARPAAGAAVAPPNEWQTWLIASADQFRLGPPPGAERTRRELRQLRRIQEERTPRMERRARFWNGVPGTVRWTELALEEIVVHRPPGFPTRTARLLGLLHIGMYDAMVAAWDSRAAHFRQRPYKVDRRIDPLFREGGSSYADPRSAIAGAAETLLTYLFPGEAPSTFEELADEATESRLWAGVNYRSDVARGRRLGRRVAEVVIGYGEADGHTTDPNVVMGQRQCSTPSCGDTPEDRQTEQFWAPTFPAYQGTPTDPAAALWETWLLASPDQLRPGPPPAYGSDEFLAELAAVKDADDNATPEEREIAFFWDDSPGSFGPAGHWNHIAIDLVLNRGLDTQQAARAFALMNAAIVDAFIATWDAKYAYWNIRPVSVIREQPEILGQPNPYHDPFWEPNLITPPFPSYTSGHSAESAAAARVLQWLFPDTAGDPPDPDDNTPQGSIDDIAEEVALSRLIGGIHFPIDNEVALVLGRQVARLAILRAQADGSGL